MLDHLLLCLLLWFSPHRAARRYPFSSVNAIPRAATFGAPAFAYSSGSGARFFGHSDLLRELFDHFRKDDYTAEDRRELLGFILISKGSFHYPSQILWSRVGTRFASALGCLLDVDMWDNNLNRKLTGIALLR